jgi:hypothetical protein
VQIEMLDKAGMKPLDRRGGPGRGQGRKLAPGKRRSVSHRSRAAFRRSQPIHASMKVLDGVVSKSDGLRKMDIYQAVRRATLTAARRDGMRVVHVSLQSSHIHLLVEADGRSALSRGMQGFAISLAKWINRALWVRGGKRGALRKGKVFADRYNSEVIATPRQARNALAYVLNNWRRHREDRGEYATKLVDKFSSGICFTGWKERAGRGRWQAPDGFEELVVWEPRTWLLHVGWRKHGLISVYERPAHALNATTTRRLARQAAAR